MKKVLSIICFIIAIIATYGAITVKGGSGFLDVSNIGRYFLIGVAIICTIIGIFYWKKK